MRVIPLLVTFLLVGLVSVTQSTDFNEIEMRSDRVKRFFYFCNVCTTRNYRSCCVYRQLCCEYITECPAPSTLQCSQPCSWGNCATGQRCCPVNPFLACCANRIIPGATTPTATTALTTGQPGATTPTGTTPRTTNAVTTAAGTTRPGG